MYNVLIVIVSHCRRISMQKHHYTLPYGSFTLIQDSKFHDFVMNYRILLPLSTETNTCANLLCKMMGDRLESSPSKSAMRKRKNMLYGVKTGTQTYALGSYQVIDLQLRGIANRFLEESMIEEDLRLIKEMFFNPLLTENTLKEAKKKLVLQHSRLKDQNQDKALLDAFMLGTEKGYLNISSLGQAEEIDAISLEQIKALHQQLIVTAPKSLVISGDCDLKEENLDIFNQGSSPSFENSFTQSSVLNTYKEQSHDGDQTELVMLFSPDIPMDSQLYIPYIVYVSYLGQLPNSLLFQVVREKHSLCYSIYSNRLVFDGVMTIQTSINDDNLEKTQALILECIEETTREIKDLESFKKKIISGLDGVDENKNSLNIRAFYDLVKNSDESVATLQDKIKAVTEKDLMAVAAKIKNPFIYAYRGDLR